MPPISCGRTVSLAGRLTWSPLAVDGLIYARSMVMLVGDRGPEPARQHLLLLADASVRSGRRCEDPTMGFPEPADLTSLVVRTDFSDDGAWRNLQTAIDERNKYPVATYVSDPEYANVAIRTLVDIDAIAESKAYYLFLADTIAMSAPGWPLLAVDLADQPGRTFRVPARWYGGVSANLCIANLDFADFADAADDSGTYRDSDRDEEHRLLEEEPWLRSGRTVHVLEGAQIGSLDDFWRFWLEIAGSNGRYFGQDLAAFDDALSGGPGWPEDATGAGFIVEWRDHGRSQASLGRSFGQLVKIFERRVPRCLKLC